jgi:cardiolipin synthase
VAIQSYYCETGSVADRLKTLLLAKAREGVEVLFLLDGFGCRSLGGSYSDSLIAGGVMVAVIRPLHWYSFHKAQHRSHVRAVLIDGRIGYTGGFGIADKWLPHEGTPGWRETTVRFTGPAVTRLAGSFAIAWSEATGHLLADSRFHASPALPRDGVVAGILFTVRQYGTPVPERYLALSLAGARQRVYITNPYFIPNRELRDWLKDAVRRKVDVRVLTAGGNIDVRWTRWASRSRYEELLEAGVRIYEYQPAMLHAKTMVIDGFSSSVGSLNLDNVSLRINDEVVLLVQDKGFGASLDSLFLADLAQADEISLEQFRRRPWIEKVREPFARMLRDFL